MGSYLLPTHGKLYILIYHCSESMLQLNSPLRLLLVPNPSPPKQPVLDALLPFQLSRPGLPGFAFTSICPIAQEHPNSRFRQSFNASIANLSKR